MAYMPTIKQLQYLIALADYKTFSQAAEYCNITQPTLSAGIAALENLLGQELVDRSHTKQVVLTPMGEDVLARARNIVQQAEALVERAQYASDPLSGPLRLGIIPTIAPYLLPRCLPALRKQYPRLELQLFEDLSARIVKELQNGHIDLLLMAFPYEAHNIESYILFEEPFVLACPKGSWPKGRAVRTENLDPEKLLLLEEGHCLRDHALAACKLTLPDTKKAFNATSLSTLVQMVQHNYGMTLLPEMAVKAEAIPDNIDILEFTSPRPTRQIGIAWRKGNQRAETFKEIGNTIKTILKG